MGGNIPALKKPLAVASCLNKCSCKCCSISGPGCRHCSKACKPCTSKCKCKGVYGNPHNNGGTCTKCEMPAVVSEMSVSETSVEVSKYLRYHNVTGGVLDEIDNDCVDILDIDAGHFIEDVDDFDVYFPHESSSVPYFEIPPTSTLEDECSDDDAYYEESSENEFKY